MGINFWIKDVGGLPMENAGFTLLKWNGQYGSAARFVVKDNKSGKQSMFTPGRTQDVIWTSMDMQNLPEVKNWDDFGNETVEDLESIAF